jgi:hypothetical protein
LRAQLFRQQDGAREQNNKAEYLQEPLHAVTLTEIQRTAPAFVQQSRQAGT